MPCVRVEMMQSRRDESPRQELNESYNEEAANRDMIERKKMLINEMRMKLDDLEKDNTIMREK